MPIDPMFLPRASGTCNPPMHKAALPVYESASIMWTFAEPGQSREGTGVANAGGVLMQGNRTP
jgi:hypothetical protein